MLMGEKFRKWLLSNSIEFYYRSIAISRCIDYQRENMQIHKFFLHIKSVKITYESKLTLIVIPKLYKTPNGKIISE